MLSVVLATHNEEKNLASCLDSIADLATEIIIVDGESTDETVAIAKKFGAMVIKTTNKQNFHINKQMAMDAATQPFVLQLDADEHVDDELKKSIAALLKTDPQQQPIKAWNLKRKNYFLGKFLTKGGQYPDPVIRLYVAGYARLPMKDVHEQMEVDGAVGDINGHLLHYSNPTFSDYLRKFNTYTQLKATQLGEQKLPITALNTLKYLVWKPCATFCSLFIRHKGFVDGVAGFAFAVMSGLHHAVAYLLLYEKTQQ